jgi:DNA polymerase-1
MNFGTLYGMGLGKFARSLALPEAQAKELRDKYHAMLPEVKLFTRKAEQLAGSRGWVRTKLNRRRRFPDRSTAYKAGNAVIQGTSADMVKLKMIHIDRLFTGRQSALMLQVHDELDWTLAPEDRALNDVARRVMCEFGESSPIQFTVPFTVDSHIADDWARASFPDWTGPNGQQ